MNGFQDTHVQVTLMSSLVERDAETPSNNGLVTQTTLDPFRQGEWSTAFPLVFCVDSETAPYLSLSLSLYLFLLCVSCVCISFCTPYVSASCYSKGNDMTRPQTRLRPATLSHGGIFRANGEPFHDDIELLLHGILLQVQSGEWRAG